MSAFARGPIAATECGSSNHGLDALAWYCGDWETGPRTVCHKRASAWGLFDMHGDVAEWCNDW